MQNQIIKWNPNEKIQLGSYELKYIRDELDNLKICV